MVAEVAVAEVAVVAEDGDKYSMRKTDEIESKYYDFVEILHAGLRDA